MRGAVQASGSRDWRRLAQLGIKDKGGKKPRTPHLLRDVAPRSTKGSEKDRVRERERERERETTGYEPSYLSLAQGSGPFFRDED